jgi:uncharacterized membrane protein YukC
LKEISIIFILGIILLLVIHYYNLFDKENNLEIIEALENDKIEYCKVINDLSKYAPDSVQNKYNHIIEFAKLQVED